MSKGERVSAAQCLCGVWCGSGNTSKHSAKECVFASIMIVLFFRVFAVVIAAGKRPVPFRTRKLSLPAPMVLHSRGCGRVGHRRTQLHTRTPESPTGPGVLAISTSDLFAVCAGNSVVAPQKSCELPIRYKSHRRRLFAGGVAGTVSAGLISATAAPAHTGSMVYTSLPGTMRCSPAR